MADSPRQSESNRQAAAATGKIGLAVMASRVLGMARDAFMIYLFGDESKKILSDCFNLAFKIPNLLRDLFAEGALSQAFVTTFVKKLQVEGERSAWKLANKIMTLATVAMSVISLLGILVAPWIVDFILMASSQAYGSVEREWIILFARIMYPFILVVSLAALVMGVLNAKNVFGMPALASCFFNLGCIIGGGLLGWLIDPTWGFKSLIGISIGVLIGGLGQLVVQFPSLKKVGFRPRWDFDWRDSSVKKVLSLMIPAVIAASAVQVNVVVNAAFAASAEAGGVSALSYAFRLMQLPIGVFGVAIATVTLPAMSRAAIGGIGDEFAAMLNRGLKMVAILVLPCAVGLGFLALPLTKAVFPNTDLTNMIAYALQAYAIGLLFYSWMKIVQPAYYAIDKRWIPMAVSFGSIAVNFVCNWYFIRVLGWGYRSLACTTSLIAVLNFTILYALLHRYAKNLHTKNVWNTLWRCLVAAFVMAELAWLANQHVFNQVSGSSYLIRLSIVILVVAALAAVYFGLCYVLGVREAHDCLQMIKRRIPWLKKL